MEATRVEQQDRPVGVGVIGAGWLGDVHARAWCRLRHHYPELPIEPRFVAVANAVDGARAAAQRKHGFARSYEDWHDLVADAEVDVVSVTAPNSMHRELGSLTRRLCSYILTYTNTRSMMKGSEA